MNTSYRQKFYILPLSFLLPALSMAAVFAVCGICPFGTRTLGVMDMNHQYLSFLYSIRDILAGKAGLFYLPSMCLGGSMAGLSAYYLMSPLNLLTCLFPREHMILAVSLLYVLRVGLCGLAMCIYTGTRYGYRPRCLVSSLAFALMAYMLSYSFNYLWQDSVILLPLVALGISRLIEKQRPWLYIPALACALIFNFYIGYILCIFSVLFFLAELMSVSRRERKETGRTLLRFALSSIAAGALAAAVLLPAFMGLSSGKAEFSLSVLELTAKFSLPELFSKLLPGSFVYEQIMPEGLPNIFCGTVTAVLAILYFTDRAISRRRRLLSGGLLLILAVSFWITALDLIWHCLNTPNWYNYRYSFLFSFLAAAMADRELLSMEQGEGRPRLLLPVAFFAAVGVLVFAGRQYDYVAWPSAVAALVISVSVCAALYAIRRTGTKKAGACILTVLVLLLHMGELGVNAGLSMSSLTAQTTDPAKYQEYVTAKGAAFDVIPDTGEYVRTESPVSFDMNRCESMLFGYDGISHYGSTISQKSLDFLDRLGFDRYTDLWALYGTGVTGAADTLLGIRYIVSPSPVRSYTAAASVDGYSVYENTAAMPIGWTADRTITDRIGEMDCFSYTNALFAAAAPELSEGIFVPAEITDISLDNFAGTDGVYTRLSETPATVTYTLIAEADGALYGELEIPDFPGVMVFVNGNYCTYYAITQTNGSFYLGNFAAGDTVTVKLQASSDLVVDRAVFATEQSAALTIAADALSQGGCHLTKLSASHYTGSFTTGEGDQLLVLTIPYDASWTVLLDGTETAAMEVQDCLMAIPVTAGEHTVELTYIPAGLIPGAVISIGALIVCVGVFVAKNKKHSPHRR